MNYFIDFLKSYWKEILLVLEIVVTIVLFIVRKRTKIINKLDYSEILKKLLETLPYFIQKVECPGNGESKKKIVLESSLEYIAQLLGRTLTVSESEFFSDYIDDAIEMILETPSKKEEK